MKLQARPARFRKELNIFKYHKKKGFGEKFKPSYWFQVEYKWAQKFGDEELEYNSIFYAIKPIPKQQRRKFAGFIERLKNDDIGEMTRDVESYFATLAVVRQLDVFAEEKDSEKLKCPNIAFVYPKTSRRDTNSIERPMNVCFRNPDKPFLKESDKLVKRILHDYIFTEDDFTL